MLNNKETEELNREIEELNKILDSIPKPNLDELMEMSLYGMRKGQRPHMKKVLEKFVESIRKY